MYDAIVLLFISIGLMVAIFGLPIFVLIKYFSKTKTEVRYPFRQPAVFTNRFGHLVRVDPDPEVHDNVIQYFNDNPDHKRRFLKDVRNPNSRENW